MVHEVKIHVPSAEGLMLKQQFKTWRHVFKLDPDKAISDDHLEQICCSGTDAVMVGGSSGTTFDNTVDLLSRIRRYEVPCVLEISEQDAVVPGFDLYFIPFILNTADVQWVVGRHQQAIKELGPWLDWDIIVTEAYIILNEQSTVAQKTKARAHMDDRDLTAYVKLAEHLFHMDSIYIEYSGEFGNMDRLQSVKQAIEHPSLIYGGGICSLEQARAAAAIADTIVVGNVIYERLSDALETVKVKEQFMQAGKEIL